MQNKHIQDKKNDICTKLDMHLQLLWNCYRDFKKMLQDILANLKEMFSGKNEIVSLHAQITLQSY